ncbi:MAG TPA: type IV secretory system conjugative DNA transfer family protein, partial [Candidatus Saccharimonadales bacterium]|nr:type IV secretory system conjugative DNA transfer family protein [Candidatus Saccharimonadales bacterium]
MLAFVIIFMALALGLGGFAFLAYRRVLRRAKGIERGLKMVPLLIHLPPPSDDTAASGRDVREVIREKISQAESLYSLIAGTATEGFKSKFYGQRHLSFEIIAARGTVHFYAAVPVALVSVVEQAIVTAYPGARVEEAEDYNIFNPAGKLSGTTGGELVLKADPAYPIATFTTLERDPMAGLLNTLSALEEGDGVGVQLLLRPARPGWVKAATALADKKRKTRGSASLKFTAKDLVKAAVVVPDPTKTQPDEPLTGLEQTVLDAIEDKTRHPGYEVLVRLVAAAPNAARSQVILRDLATAFALFDAPGLNGFKFLPAGDIAGLVTAFIFRFFPPELGHDILNSVELATLFHLPDAQFTPTSGVERQASKQVDGPVAVSPSGLLFGYNLFRGVKKEIRLSTEDRRRHTYIVGQTGTGKSVLLENLAVQDMLAGNGFAFIDPHGDTAERLISMVPKNRAEDVIYFNPADTETPLGLNLFEFSDPAQKDFLIQEAIGMLYKLYDPGHTGIIGPRYEHWFRNAALTLMSDPNGATFIEIPKVFTDADYLRAKFKHLTDQTVIDFWTKEMGQTSDYHKSEMLGWFVSKFGAFMSNEIMRNIIGQPKSAFNLREVMDQKKILIVNLSKGQIGELNSQLLGMLFVIKFQAAAMSRAAVAESERPDFCLYVDEFQNFSTDSFASILSEARKYRLNLIVANQFIGQLSEPIRDAVFGNVGTVVSLRTGPEDADFLVKQFAPVFDAHDLVNLPIG